jgi:hypothetical protein
MSSDVKLCDEVALTVFAERVGRYSYTVEELEHHAKESFTAAEAFLRIRGSDHDRSTLLTTVLNPPE